MLFYSKDHNIQLNLLLCIVMSYLLPSPILPSRDFWWIVKAITDKSIDQLTTPRTGRKPTILPIVVDSMVMLYYKL